MKINNEIRNMLMLSAILLISCKASNLPAQTTQTSNTEFNTELVKSESSEMQIDSIVQFLINASASDFHKTRPNSSINFRDVKLAYIVTPNNEKMYLLCGEFQIQEKNDKDKVWIPFATIKTFGYEQWIGGQASTYCKEAKEILIKKYNLSSQLKERIETLR